MWNPKKKKEYIYLNRNRITNRENELMVTKEMAGERQIRNMRLIDTNYYT